jgi:hypothetical protein
MVRAEDRDIQAIQEELVKAGLLTVRLAKQRVRVDTGRLRSSITLADSTGVIQDSGPEANPQDSVNPPNSPGIRVGTNVDYAEYIENLDPFLMPSWDEAKRRFNIQT